MLLFRPVSSLEKCFPDSKIEDFSLLTSASVLKNESLSFQLLYRDATPEQYFAVYYITLACDKIPADKLTVRRVDFVPSTLPTYLGKNDDGFLRTEPGLYPDLLSPLTVYGAPVTATSVMHALWVDVAPGALPVGTHEVTFRILKEGGEELGCFSLTLTVVDADFPPQELIYTNWFHCDCLASRYEVDVFSEEHWRIIENYVACAVRGGMNTLLTPVVTPPLDTRVGGERPTVQLVDISRSDGVYTFGFEKLVRFVEMAKRCGIRYFEIAHLFTQWGAEHAPKIMATTERGYERIFGWETDAGGEEYAAFLQAFIPALREKLETLGVLSDCFFHVSDEPNEYHLKSYGRAVEIIRPLLQGCTVMDALSRVEFFKTGLVEHPIPSNDHIENFIEAGFTDLWTYYCCNQAQGVSNRFMAMPGARTRYLGVQMWYYGVKGFLHWGFNFWYSRSSIEEVDPFRDTTGCGFSPSGDCFVVYPGKKGEPLESMRLYQFREGLEDMRALALAEQLCGRETVLAAITPITGEIRFDRCLLTSREMLAVREAVNALIASAC